MLLQQITPSMSKKMMRKGGGASAMSGQWCPPLASVSGELLPLVGALPCQGFALQLHGACKSNPDMESQFRRRFCRGSKPAGISTAARLRKSSFGLGWVAHTYLMKLWIIGGFNRKTWRGLAQAGLLFQATNRSRSVHDLTP